MFLMWSQISPMLRLYMTGTRGIRGYSTFTDYLNTEPFADWVSLESNNHSIVYEKFLDTMVKKTLEVRQRMAELSLESFLTYDQDIRKYVRVAHAVKILDPTFQPPRINMESAWQVEFIKKFCKFFTCHLEICTIIKI